MLQVLVPIFKKNTSFEFTSYKLQNILILTNFHFVSSPFTKKKNDQKSLEGILLLIYEMGIYMVIIKLRQ